MTTKKDFEATARIIARAVYALKQGTEPTGQFRAGGEAMISHIAISFNLDYSLANPRFSSARFFAACGLNEKGELEARA